MTILTTARLRFEPFHEGHLDGLQAMNHDPEVQRYLMGRPETPEEMERLGMRYAGLREVHGKEAALHELGRAAWQAQTASIRH
jgi:hypothetical protein